MEIAKQLSAYSGKRVFVTGHTGFKGSWLVAILNKLGARVMGYALAPNTSPNHFDLTQSAIESIIGDIRDSAKLKAAVQGFAPDIILHLAAQPLVRYSYQHPVETYETNVIGTLHLYEAARATPSVRAIVSITTDKVYKNKEWQWGYRENEELGGYDPYSASKACVEIMTSSYRNSFFNLNDYGTKHQVLLATVRAGNVIGGGDWSLDRLIPDIVKSSAEGKDTFIRNPAAVRPWQHVVEPVVGYLLVGVRLLNGEQAYADAFNFGPNADANVAVKTIAEIARRHWAAIAITLNDGTQGDAPHEANLLFLDNTKAKKMLGWKPLWNLETTIAHTIDWYRSYYTQGAVLTEAQIETYLQLISQTVC